MCMYFSIYFSFFHPEKLQQCLIKASSSMSYQCLGSKSSMFASRNESANNYTNFTTQLGQIPHLISDIFSHEPHMP